MVQSLIQTSHTVKVKYTNEECYSFFTAFASDAEHIWGLSMAYHSAQYPSSKQKYDLLGYQRILILLVGIFITF